MEPQYNPYEVLSKPKNVIEGLEQRRRIFEAGGETQRRGANGVFFEEVEADAINVQVENLVTTIDQGSLFIEKDFIFISLEEANVDFTVTILPSKSTKLQQNQNKITEKKS